MDNQMNNNPKASTLADVYRYIEQYESRLSKGPNSRTRIFYRGQSNYKWPIKAGVNRENVKVKEIDLLSTYKLDDNMTFFEKIAYIQHYYTGTRFVDFTVNPDVALYFACSENEDKDGSFYIWSYAPDSPEWYRIIVFEELLNLKQQEKISIQEFSEILYEKHKEIREKFDNVDDVSVTIISYIGYGFMIMPAEKEYENNIRLKRQEGCFFICGVDFEKQLESHERWASNAGKNYFYPHKAIEPDRWNETDEEYPWFKKIMIPKESKIDILNELMEKGITREYLMPDL